MATITKLQSGNYRIRKNYNGKTFSAVLDHQPSQKEAEKYLFEKIIKSDGIRKKTSSLSLLEAGKKYIEIRRPVISPTTIRCYYEYLNTFEDTVLRTQINDFDKDYLQTLINDMYLNGLSPKSIKNRVGLVISIIREFNENFNPKIKYPQKKKIKVHIPSDDDYSKIMELAAGTEYEIALYLAAFGLRRSEICGLTMDDVKDGGVYIHQVKVLGENNQWIIKSNPKNKDSERFVPLPEHVLNLIRDKGYIYKYSPRSLSEYIHKCAKKLQLQDFSLHKLRHYFATKAHYLSIPDKSIMYLGGWKTDYVMKNIYRHEDEVAAQSDMKRLQDHILNKKKEEDY